MFILIDKPLGISSFDVIRKLRKKLWIKKMGHSWTLDPLATWCLLIATDNSTKLLPLLENSYKEYIFTVRLDGKSQSYDLWTEIEKVNLGNMVQKSNDELIAYLLSLKEQIPPKYSALHIGWERAYNLARKWEDFELTARKIDVKNVEILERGTLFIRIKMTLSSWGYIRSFAPVIGKYFGSDWGYIESLRRTKIFTKYWPIDISEASEIEKDILQIDYNKLFHTIPIIDIDLQVLGELQLWKSIPRQEESNWEQHSLVFLKNSEQNYMSLCERNNEFYTIIKNNVL